MTLEEKQAELQRRVERSEKIFRETERQHWTAIQVERRAELALDEARGDRTRAMKKRELFKSFLEEN